MSQVEPKKEEVIELGENFLTTLFQKSFQTAEKNAELIAKAISKLQLTVKDHPDTFSVSEIGRKSTTNTSRQNDDNPDLEFQNPLDIEAVVREITFIPNSAFKTKGMLVVTINDVTIFSNKVVADFTDVTDGKIPIPEGKTIKRKDKVKVFIWNGTDSNAVILTVQVTFAESLII